MFDVSKRLALGAALTAPFVGTALPAASASAAPAPHKTHCVTRALSPERLAHGEPSTLTCFGTFGEALASVGIHAEADIEPVGLSAAVMTSSTTILAVHYDNADGSGSSLTVQGDCNGSGISLDSTWSDRISSTRNGACNTVKHYDSTSYSGTQENTTGAGQLTALGVLNNAVGSIKYTN